MTERENENESKDEAARCALLDEVIHKALKSKMMGDEVMTLMGKVMNEMAVRDGFVSLGAACDSHPQAIHLYARYAAAALSCLQAQQEARERINQARQAFLDAHKGRR